MRSMDHIWQQYLDEGGEANATAFGVWLIRHSPEVALATAPKKMPALESNGYPSGYEAMDLSVRSAILVGRLERFLHHLTKGTFKEVGINEDEFLVLATLLYMPRATKTQLLRQCLIEIPTGSELLKRMKAAGLLLEKPNPDDGRSTFIIISAKGKQILFKGFQKLEQVEDALSVLSAEDKHNLLFLLNRLDAHHSKRHDIKQVSELMQMGPIA